MWNTKENILNKSYYRHYRLPLYGHSSKYLLLCSTDDKVMHI